MSFLSHTALAFSMSADAFAASVAQGVTIRKPKLRDAVRIGAIFGLVETITPLIGWVIGIVASQFIAAVDHWVAFSILAVVGGKMVWEGLTSHPEARQKSQKLSVLILTAIGTSIDAMAVGITLALLESNIIVIALMIGAATFIMATLGIMFGQYLGARAGRIAEVLGGFCLMAIGTKILVEHLGLLG